MGSEEIRQQMIQTRASLDRKLELLERRARPVARRAARWVAAAGLTTTGVAIGVVLWRWRAAERRRRLAGLAA